MPNTVQKWYQYQWGKLLIAFFALFSVFAVAFGFYFVNLVMSFMNGASPVETAVNFDRTTVEGLDNYYLGPEKSTLTLVEFSDFACPYCRQSFSKIRELAARYPLKLKFIVRDYPAHEESIALAMAARCSGEQGLFWQMYDQLFINQGVKTNAELTKLASRIGVNAARFEQCLTGEKYKTRVLKDYEDADKLGVQGTPTWFINNRRIAGNIPFDTMMKIIEETVKENQKSNP